MPLLCARRHHTAGSTTRHYQMLSTVHTALIPVFDMGGAKYSLIVGPAVRMTNSKDLMYRSVLKKGAGKD